LYNLDLTNNARLERVRDVFCFSCFTGLRFSDTVTVNRGNVRGAELFITTRKTSDNLSIPLSEQATSLLVKYDCKLPSISQQKTNDYIKELGKLAGIDEPTELTKHRGAAEVKKTEPKYKFMTTHTARRTFVTLALERGMRAETVKAITGHKDDKSFKNYIKITDKIKILEMQKVWSVAAKPLLKVV
jgi:integrase